jgi:rubrerythrin
MNSTTILGALDGEISSRAVSRRDALLHTGKLAGAIAVATLPLSLGLMTRKAFAQGPITEAQLDTLNFALTLERLEAGFYSQGLASGLNFGDTRPIFEQISKHETAHVALLETLLADNALPAPTFDFTGGGQFGSVFTSLDTFIALSQGFEDLGVRAYKGQLAELADSAELLTGALRIHSVEARHAAMVRRLPQSPAAKSWITGNDGATGALAPIYAGEEVSLQLEVDVQQFGSPDAATEAFDEPLEREAVEAIIAPFIVPAEETQAT